jgi:hypothetical protein
MIYHVHDDTSLTPFAATDLVIDAGPYEDDSVAQQVAHQICVVLHGIAGGPSLKLHIREGGKRISQ